MADENKPAAEGTPNPDPQPNPLKPETWTLKVYGEDVPKTKEEVIALAQKGVAADRAFQEAAAIKAKAENALVLQESLLALQSGFDPAVARKALGAMGLTGEDLEAAVEAAKAQVEASQQVATQPNQGNVPPQKPSKIKYQDLSPELQAYYVEREQERQNKLLEAAIAKDSVLQYNYKKAPEKLINLGQRVLRRRVFETGREIGDGTHIMPEVVGELRAILQDFGTPGPPSAGLGPAPSSEGTSLYPTKEPKRPSVTDTQGHEDYIVKKMGHMIATMSQPT